MRKWLWLGMVGAVAGLAALAGTSGAAQAQVPDVGCSNALLQGDYGFSIQGQFDGIITLEGMPPVPVLHPFASPLPFNGVAMQHFDGNGKFTQVDFNLLDGIHEPGAIISTGFDGSEAGPYTVNPDCTGTFTIQIPPPPATPLTTVTVMFVLARNGHEIHTAVKALHAPGAPPAADGTLCTSNGMASGTDGCNLGVNVRSDGVKLGLDQ